MNFRLFIALLVLLVIAYSVGIGVGLGRGDGDNPSLDQADFLDGLADRLPKQTLNSDDIDRIDPLDCFDAQRDELTVVAGTPCRLNIAAAQGQRVLELRLVSGDAAELVLSQPVNSDGGILSSDKRLVAGQSAEIDIYRRQTENDHIRLVVTCQSTDSPCRLQFP